MCTMLSTLEGIFSLFLLDLHNNPQDRKGRNNYKSYIADLKTEAEKIRYLLRSGKNKNASTELA